MKSNILDTLVGYLLLACFLAACSLVPPIQQASKDLGPNPLAQPISTLAQNSGKGTTTPEMITFPNMVKTTELAPPEPTQKQELDTLLQELRKQKEAQEAEPNAQPDPDFKVNGLLSTLLSAELADFVVGKAKRSYEVQVPTSGNFQLKLQAGNKFKVLDNNATDGEAVIQLPTGTFDTLFHLEGKWQKDSSLKVKDELYYVDDTLSSEKKKLFDLDRWFVLGKRPLPVPSDWHSPDGQNFVLRFDASQIKGFQMVWFKTSSQVSQAPFPPGIKEIGPEGGAISVAGLGELEIPPGALNSQTVIVMRQRHEVYAVGDWDDFPGPDEVDVAPPVQFLPEGLQFDKPAYIRLALDPQKTRGYLPWSLRYISFPSSHEDFVTKGAEDLSHAMEKAIYPDRFSMFDWFEIPHFSYVRAMLNPSDYSPNYGSESGDFQLAANYQMACFSANLGLPTSDTDQKPFYVLHWKVTPSNSNWEAQKQAVCLSLIQSWKDFAAINPNTGIPKRGDEFNYQGTKHKVVKVELKSQEDHGLTFAHFPNFDTAYMLINHGLGVEDLLEVAAHENYHAVQVRNIKKYNVFALQNPWGDINGSVDRAWLTESTARFMGNWSVYHHHSEYVQNVSGSNGLC